MFRTVPLSIIRSFSLYTRQWCMSYTIADSSQAVSKPVWHIPLLCVQWKTPDDGQRNCPKHVEFYSKNKFEKLVHVVGFIIRVLTFIYFLYMWHVSAIIRRYYENIKVETDRTKEEASPFTMNNIVKGEDSSLMSMLSDSTVINLLLRERKLILQTPFQSFWYILLNDWCSRYRGIEANVLLIMRKYSQNTMDIHASLKDWVHFEVEARSNSTDLWGSLCGLPIH